MTRNKKITGGIIAVIVLLGLYGSILGAPGALATRERFVVPRNESRETTIVRAQEAGFVRSSWALDWVLQRKGVTGNIPPGAYRVSKAMNVFAVASRLAGEPEMRWVVIPEGLRKEEIADIFARELGWTDAQKRTWIEVDTNPDADHREGVYFPDTYLVATDESPADVAKRLRVRFEEQFNQLSGEAAKQNIKWTTVVKVASLLEREAAGKDDLALVAGIIWNRLLVGQKLDIDATVQYARGDTGKGWWAPITVEDKKIDSPYNTYLYRGLPPGPISNPGLDALGAVLFPEKTNCFYYLHDKTGKIRCSATFDGHLNNIDRYF